MKWYNTLVTHTLSYAKKIFPKELIQPAAVGGSFGIKQTVVCCVSLSLSFRISNDPSQCFIWVVLHSFSNRATFFFRFYCQSKTPSPKTPRPSNAQKMEDLVGLLSHSWSTVKYCEPKAVSLNGFCKKVLSRGRPGNLLVKIQQWQNVNRKHWWLSVHMLSTYCGPDTHIYSHQLMLNTLPSQSWSTIWAAACFVDGAQKGGWCCRCGFWHDCRYSDVFFFFLNVNTGPYWN